MIKIDKYAYCSALRKINPGEKVFFSILTMILCIAINNIVYSSLIIIALAFFIVGVAKIPFKVYYSLMLAPLVFIIIGTLTIAVNIVDDSSKALLSFSLVGIRLGCTEESLITSVNIMFKALSSVSCLYFLVLTTPIFEVLTLLRKLKVPKLFVELMGLIYRFIFVLLDRANMIYIVQNSRLGYCNMKTAFASMGALVSDLFISAYKRSDDIYTAMESRLYEGDINLIEDQQKISTRNIILILIFELLILGLSVMLNYFGGKNL